jgi:hypothetical protein
MAQRIRVGVAGISGLLGFRLAQAITRQPDLELSVGIAKSDRSLHRLIAAGSTHRGLLPVNLFLDDTHAVVRRTNQEQSGCQFQPFDQCNLNRLCDVVIDAIAPGRLEPLAAYEHFTGPVIFQSGEYPLGRLIAPPILAAAATSQKRYRQGDCIVSALSPILALFQREARCVRIVVHMQYSDYLHDYPTGQRTNATYIRTDLARQFEDELTILFPAQTIEILTVLQVPGLDYYTVAVELDCVEPLSGETILELIDQSPRIALADRNLRSTYEIDHFLREPAALLGTFFPPIVVYQHGLSPAVGSSSRRIRLQFSVYSRFIAVLPNIDSIRMLRGVNHIEAMQLTDIAMSV